MAEIEHVVVLMLENRSFDSMLGRLYEGRADFNGVPADASNTWNGKNYPVWTSAGALTPDSACIPTPDPAETFIDMTEQIFGAGNEPPAPATMGGFVSNYAKTSTYRPGDVMHGFTPQQVPVLSQLAVSFGVCDDWHASAPNQTWPNRFFAHTGTAYGYVNNSPPEFPYEMNTVFELLGHNERTWNIYFHDMPQSATLSKLWADLPTHLHSFDDFVADAQHGKLPNYSFIEPQYFSDPVTRSMPNDQHPPHDVRYGEQLIARCYNALRSGPGWKKTLFVIVYDEHGGLYDHVAPPTAVSPDTRDPDGFTFNRYGVRIPAVIVSPWIAPGSIVRRPAGSPYPFDHTSIIASLRAIFGLQGPPLGAREAVAPHLADALRLPEPTNDGPEEIPVPSIAPTDAELSAAHGLPPNAHQHALIQAMAHLPVSIADIDQHLTALATGGGQIQPPISFHAVGDALDTAKGALERFLSSVLRL